jgi:hypothetical protein
MVLFHYHARGNGPPDLPYGRSICSYAHECTGGVLDSIAELSASPEQTFKEVVQNAQFCGINQFT